MMNWRRFYTFLIEDNDNDKDKIMVSTILPRISSETNDKDKGSDKGKGTYHHARRVLSGSQGYGHVSPTLAEATKKPNFKIGWASFFLDRVTFRLLSVGSHFNPWTGPLGTERKVILKWQTTTLDWRFQFGLTILRGGKGKKRRGTLSGRVPSSDLHLLEGSDIISRYSGCFDFLMENLRVREIVSLMWLPTQICVNTPVHYKYRGPIIHRVKT